MLFISPLLWSACSKTDKGILKEIDAFEELLQTETAENLVIEHTDSGLLKLVLEAPKAITKRGIERPFTEMPEGLLAKFYNQLGEIESTISSEYGIYYTEEATVLLRNKVDVVNVKQERLETEELLWNQNTKKISTTKFVKITTPTETLTGYGMEADEDFSNWVIKDASGNFKLDP